MATTSALVLFAVVSVFASAFLLPPRTSRKIARIMAGIALAVQVVALDFLIVLWAGDYSPAVLLWIAVGWIAFPIALCGLALALELREEPAVSPVFAISMLLFGIYAVLSDSGGQFVAPSSLLLLFASVYALGSQFETHRRSTRSANG